MRIALFLGTDEPDALPASDQAAVGLAVGKLAGDVHAYSLRGDVTALRYALAAGAMTASVVDDPTAVEFDVALLGRGGCEPWGDLLPAMLAERDSRAMVLEVIDLDVTPEGLRVTRDAGRGARDVLHVRCPAVLAVSDEAPQQLYVSHYRRHGVEASRLPSGIPPDKALATVGGDWQPVRPRVSAAAVSGKTGGNATERMTALLGLAAAGADATREHVLKADPETAARYLLRYLGHHGFIEDAVAETVPESRSLAMSGGLPPSHEASADESVPSSPREEASDRRGRGPRPLGGIARSAARHPRLVKSYLDRAGSDSRRQP